MNEMPLFADKSPEEIDAIFYAYTERGFDDLPTDMFFAMMGDISEPPNDPQNSEALNPSSSAFDAQFAAAPKVSVPA